MEINLKVPFLATVIFIFSVANCSAKPKKGNEGFWIDLGLKGGFGTTWLFNSNTLGGSVISNNFSPGWSYGAKLGLNFTQTFEISGDFLMTGFNQSYSVNTASPKETWTKNVQGQLMDIPVLMRFNLEGSYIEFGPQFSMASGFTESNSGFISSSSNVTSSFNSTEVEGVFGFGRWIRSGADNFNFTLGLRVMYGFGDFISATGKSGTLSYPASNDPAFLAPFNSKTFASYAPTHPFSAMLVLEFNYDMAYIFLKNVCHRTSGR